MVGSIWTQVSTTLQETAAGFVIGAASGLTAGVALGRSGFPSAVLAPLIRAANAVPRIVLASLEDALAVQERPNVPGTTAEFPNWRLALPATLEQIVDADGVKRIVSEMTKAGRSASQPPPQTEQPSPG